MEEFYEDRICDSVLYCLSGQLVLAITNEILPAFHQTESVAENEEEANRKS